MRKRCDERKMGSKVSSRRRGEACRQTGSQGARGHNPGQGGLVASKRSRSLGLGYRYLGTS
jgi:hypothetical protein